MILDRLEWGSSASPALVCIHGVGSDAQWWARAGERWADAGFRVIAFELRGHGSSGWEPPWTHATYVADLLESVTALGLDQVDWAGFSFGGRLLLDLAAVAPERIRRAVIMEPVVQISPDLALHRATQELTGDVWPSVEEFLGGRENIAGTTPEMVAAAARQFDTLPDGRVRRRTCQSAIVSIFSEFAAAPPPASTLTVPALLLHAPAFGLVSAEQQAAYAPYLRRVVEVPGMHDVLDTALEETVTAVQEFLTAETV
ncbi:alpha/beta fold hydrolase [Pimelobacter simplex]|uniref:alpha/beta fold hydrolase n=1 Tax=Nocardioides simplex TaxID=2045 RepID=UPI002150099A|nr:alpha/beta hydrolase [Pimelobacter simplex]UUW91437.1 alpha/beta hydrolase [Pimelobacter simplex]UUW95265.1 alpha/beta hydrolase [Pimelobacter simplex]